MPFGKRVERIVFWAMLLFVATPMVLFSVYYVVDALYGDDIEHWREERRAVAERERRDVNVEGCEAKSLEEQKREFLLYKEQLEREIPGGWTNMDIAAMRNVSELSAKFAERIEAEKKQGRWADSASFDISGKRVKNERSLQKLNLKDCVVGEVYELRDYRITFGGGGWTIAVPSDLYPLQFLSIRIKGSRKYSVGDYVKNGTKARYEGETENDIGRWRTFTEVE